MVFLVYKIVLVFGSVSDFKVADANLAPNLTVFLTDSGFLGQDDRKKTPNKQTNKSPREILEYLSDKHDKCSTRSAEGLSAVKGHLNTAYTEYTSLQVHSKCVDPHAARGHSPSYPSSTWGQSPCCMFRSGLMHGDIHPLNIAGEEGGKETVERNQRKKTTSGDSITRHCSWLLTQTDR